MRIALIGAGAIGTHLAVRFAREHQVSVLARGETLLAVRERGLTLYLADEPVSAAVVASNDAAELGEQDIIFVTVKAPSLPAIRKHLIAMVGATTRIVFIQNGIPWWYPCGLPSTKLTPPTLPFFGDMADLENTIPFSRMAGGAIYSGNEVIAPGVVRNTSPNRNRLSVGPVRPQDRGLWDDLPATIEAAGLIAPIVSDIRTAVWSKLAVNLGFSSLALLTRRPESVVRLVPDVGAIFVELVREGMKIAETYGYSVSDSINPIELRDGALNHRSSLLQDFECGRESEIANLIFAPLAFARAAQVATPMLDVIAPLCLAMNNAVRLESSS
jgi:2-dehydropantoate 2-reductase